MTISRPDERGASAVLIAALMILFLGIAAVAIDLSAGFNERAQDQNAGDNGVMAGALDLADGQAGDVAVASSLVISAENLTAQFGSQTDPAWVELWRSCTDDGNPGWIPMPEPSSWASVPTASVPAPTGNETLDCVSRTTSLYRVRIPDQSVDTSFGKAIGFDSLATNATSIAKLELQSPVPPLIPFGLAGSITVGESCFGTATDPASLPPCNGPNSGAFGAIRSEFFGDFYQIPGVTPCSNPEASNSIEIAVALGLDHELEVWPDAASVPIGTPEPGATKNSVKANPSQHLDACSLDPDGNPTPDDGIPINTVLVDSGNLLNELKNGLVSNMTWLGTKSRLQQGSGPFRNIVAFRTNGGETVWPLDNVGPWDYLVSNSSDIGECQPDAYTSAPDTMTRVDTFGTCLASYAAKVVADSNFTVDIFSTNLDSSPRFVWSPQYTYELSDNSQSYQPIRRFRMSFIAGTFFSCNSGGCAVVFYPDKEFTTELCDLNPNNLNCAALALNQFSAWVLPDNAVPDEIQDRFYNAYDDLEPVLYQ